MLFIVIFMMVVYIDKTILEENLIKCPFSFLALCLKKDVFLWKIFKKELGEKQAY